MKCGKNNKNLNSKIFKITNGRLIMQRKCADCRVKKSRFVNEQEAKDLLTNLGIKAKCIKMNKILNNFLLAGDKFMPELHLKQPEFT